MQRRPAFFEFQKHTGKSIFLNRYLSRNRDIPSGTCFAQTRRKQSEMQSNCIHWCTLEIPSQTRSIQLMIKWTRPKLLRGKIEKIAHGFRQKGIITVSSPKTADSIDTIIFKIHPHIRKRP